MNTKVPRILKLRHNKRPGWLQFPQYDLKGASQVVKGTNRRVIVVRSPDEKIFEQAIFIIRDDYLRRNTTDSSDLLEQARRTANEYVKTHGLQSRKRRLKKPLYAAAGLAAGGLAWLAVHFVGVLF